MSTPTIDPLTMRRAMGRFATGVAVITTEDESGPHGMTVNSLTSVSLEPPLLLVCFNHGARSAAAVEHAGRFVVNILARRQKEIALRFAQRGADHFADLEPSYGSHSVPVVPGSLAHLDCEVSRTVEAGDHTIVLGAVTAVCSNDGQPLGFYAGHFSDVQPHGEEIEPWFC
ncbi:flavin reductase family protein [Amycolatopsis granulosa]|uniref:flavin reductase family protein n=1 Tax=Amycolatopsis granulosa TaxID=185684 RepID=UPI0014229B9B|nr:flavin reductase family protein [Amycolatopsis granulosa]NIH86581.1 flavin reductase (DIM6/NTAB) family NADH-FMN oxidoreductase RutF [Amycolatopsis granulosa]